jgi:hypothetical protein
VLGLTLESASASRRLGPCYGAWLKRAWLDCKGPLGDRIAICPTRLTTPDQSDRNSNDVSQRFLQLVANGRWRQWLDSQIIILTNVVTFSPNSGNYWHNKLGA